MYLGNPTAGQAIEPPRYPGQHRPGTDTNCSCHAVQSDVFAAYILLAFSKLVDVQKLASYRVTSLGHVAHSWFALHQFSGLFADDATADAI